MFSVKPHPFPFFFIQGVWNSVDGYVLTDPVIHSKKKKAKGMYGSTDRGPSGMNKFFVSHSCNALCRLLGLEQAGDN
jgi:hypothetical protein